MFPITASTEQALIAEAKPAKFGKGKATLLDSTVRNVWEIAGRKIKIGQPWDQKLSALLQELQKDLLLSEEGRLETELHNLVIYQEGRFFKGHQESEKTDGMIATLVVLLPLQYRGGALLIDQHGDQQEFKAPRDLQEALTRIAFYADCYHEVQKVTSGYRIALTYRLVFTPSAEGLRPLKNAKLERAVKAYFDAPEQEISAFGFAGHPRWFSYLLDHQYSQKSLSWQGLRGADRKRVAHLFACADSLGLEAYLALADLHKTWDTQSD